MTLEELVQLKYGQILRSADGRRYKVNGKPQSYKRNINNARMPVKHGLYTYGYVTSSNIHLFEKEDH